MMLLSVSWCRWWNRWCIRTGTRNISQDVVCVRNSVVSSPFPSRPIPCPVRLLFHNSCVVCVSYSSFLILCMVDCCVYNFVSSNCAVLFWFSVVPFCLLVIPSVGLVLLCVSCWLFSVPFRPGGLNVVPPCRLLVMPSVVVISSYF